MQQMAPDIFVRILRGMGACRKKPAQPASGTLSWMTPSETLLRLCLGGFGKIFAKQRLLLAFVRFHGPIFETEKPFENVCTTRGLPCKLLGSRLGQLLPSLLGKQLGSAAQATTRCCARKVLPNAVLQAL